MLRALAERAAEAGSRSLLVDVGGTFATGVFFCDLSFFFLLLLHCHGVCILDRVLSRDTHRCGSRAEDL